MWGWGGDGHDDNGDEVRMGTALCGDGVGMETVSQAWSSNGWACKFVPGYNNKHSYKHSSAIAECLQHNRKIH